MKILGIDSSAETVAFSLIEDRTILASFCGNMKKTHSNTLLPTIEYLLSYAGITASDIDLFAVSVGPGSFTGIRIGVATVKGLSFGANKPICPVSTMEAMAYSFTAYSFASSFEFNLVIIGFAIFAISTMHLAISAFVISESALKIKSIIVSNSLDDNFLAIETTSSPYKEINSNKLTYP